MAVLHGTKHDDVFDESSDTSNDTFDLYKGGNDTVHGGHGDDRFNMGASFNAADRLDGGDGRNVVSLHGDYSAGVTFDNDTIQNIQVLRLGAGFSYNLTLADGNVAQSGYLTVNAAALEAGHTLTFDGSKESNGHLILVGGAGDDLLTGGKRADILDLSVGGHDTVHGGDGNDTFIMGRTLTAADSIDGGNGNDTVVLEGQGDDFVQFTATTMTNIETLLLGGAFGSLYEIRTNDATVAVGATLAIDATALTTSTFFSFDGAQETNGNFDFKFGMGLAASDMVTGGAGNDALELNGGDDIVFGATTISSIETLKLSGGSFDITTNDGNVASGAKLTVDASALTAAQALTFDGSAELNGHFTVVGGAGADVITGGNKDDTITGGSGADTFAYTNAAQSTSVTYDTITDFAAGTDKIDLNVSVAAVINTENHSVSAGSFDSDLLAAGSGDDQLDPHDARIVHADGGDLIGHDFLVIDVDGNAQYTAGVDYVIDITGYTGTLTTGDFI